MPRKTNNQKVANSVRGSVEKFSGDLEALSSQIASLTDAIISEKNLAASKIKSERELLARKTALQNIKEDIDDLRSERRKNQDKLDRLISEQQKEAEKEKEDNRKEQNYYKDAAANAYKSGNFVSGLIFEFLGRNEKDKKQIEAERKADRQDQIQELRNRSKELNEQTKSLKDIRNNISVLNTNIVNAEEERMYVQRDAEKPVSDISKFASVKLLDIEPEALSKLEKLIKKDSTNTNDPLSFLSSNVISKLLGTTLSAIMSSSIAIAAIATIGTSVLIALGFKKLIDRVKEAELKQEEQQKIRDQELERQRTTNGGKLTEKQKTEAIKEAGEQSIPVSKTMAGVLSSGEQTTYQINARNEEFFRKEAERKQRESILKRDLDIKDTLSVPTKLLEQWIRADEEKLKLDESKSIFDASKMFKDQQNELKRQIEYNKSVLSGRTDRTITPQNITPVIPESKQPTVQVESSFTDNILGKIGSFIPTGVGSLTPTAMAATTKYTPTKAPEKQKLPFEELVGKLVKSESSGKSDIINAIGAAGLYQFTQGTAMEQIRLMKNKGIREDITKKFEGKELSSIGKDPILKYISEAKGKDGDTQQNRIKELKKQGKIASDFDVTSYIRKQYPNSVAATVASLNQEEQAAMYEQFLDPLIKAKGGKDKVDFADIKAYGFASGTYLAALRANNMNLPIYNFNTEQGKNVLSKNPFMGPWDKNADGILTAQELRDATSLMDPSIKSGSQIYTAAANNKAMQQQTPGNNVVAVNNNVVTNNQTTMPNVRPRPEEPFNPLKLLYNLYPTL